MSSCCSRSARSARWRARARSTPRALRSDFGYVFDHASPIGEVVRRLAHATSGSTADFRGAAAHAGIRPEDGRSAILAAARAIAAMRARAPRRARRPRTSARSRAAAAINVVPERCTVVAEVRGLRRRARRGGRRRDRRAPPRGRQPARVRVRRGRRRAAHVRRLPTCAAEAPGRARRRGGAARPAAIEPVRISSGGASDANALLAQGFDVRQPRQRHRAQPRARRARQRRRRSRACSTSRSRCSTRPPTPRSRRCARRCSSSAARSCSMPGPRPSAGAVPATDASAVLSRASTGTRAAPRRRAERRARRAPPGDRRRRRSSGPPRWATS